MDEAVDSPLDPGPDALVIPFELREQWAAEAEALRDDVVPARWVAEADVADLPGGDPGAGEFDGAGLDAGGLTPAERRVVSSPVLLEFMIEDAGRAQAASNQAMANQLGALVQLMDVARQNPSVYLTAAGLGQRDALELAERTAAQDAGLHLHVSTDVIRNRAHEGRVLIEQLPALWEAFRAGAIGYLEARAAVDLVCGIENPAKVARFDRELAEKAGTITPGAFRQKARALRQRLIAEPVLRHVKAVMERRVLFEAADDGMMWIQALVSAADGIRVKARLDATAKRTAKEQAVAARTTGAPRQSRDQIRADLLVAWLAGDGTPTAAKVRPLVFVPLLNLIGKGDGHQPAVLQGYGPIDEVTAAQLFADAPGFRRVGTDPFTGEILDFDRARYRPTKAQREALAVKYGTCAGENCDRLAATADIDHLREWFKDQGLTNLDNLIPLCPGDHRIKTYSKIKYTREPDGGITVTTPTGYKGRTAPPPPLPYEPALLHEPALPYEPPPF